MTDFYALLPSLVLGVGGMVLLLGGVLNKKTDTTPAVTFGAVVLLLIAALLNLTAPDGMLFHGLFTTSLFTRFADTLVYIGAIAALILSVDFNKREKIARFEYPILVLFAVLGMIAMISASDMMSLYLGFELQSLALYICAALARDNLRSTEAGLKYFVLGALASGLLVYGISLVYGFAGTTSFTALANVFQKGADTGTIAGVVFVLVGLAFKVSAAPFHMWAPDVYEGAPTSVTALFATAPKAAAMALFLSVMAGPFGHLTDQWEMLIQIIAVLSMVIGGLAAIGQNNIKRLLAYSSISHMGYALMGLAVGTVNGIQASLAYIAIYVVMSFGAFACVVAMRRNGKAVENIDDLAGLSSERPGFAFAFAVFMWSMAGIPPLAGFFAKLYVFATALNAGYDTLTIIGIIVSVISAFYYLRVIKVMYFDRGEPQFDRTSAGAGFVMVIGALATIFFVVVPGPLMAVAGEAAKALMG
ncbi:NADH-quinone oxidoreductase subunit NuoN [Acidocella aminolytica]|uniref:NADH-quinone oxidoreductase subunit N n=1 Tax=Acidocella aminolytica 101 = DSM 11237 TaxID=1120923 RepID=A0A0D6PET4_9PROT|nr:NADH-quinone oxidoreductase subunit NuoN [Acidocella aminolytica]GAN79713.1 NADH-quinone oxidoreductase subunit N [Acidocella aminolytica 101 = DSM 11237]GBQ39823.1 NADH-quinone oxidoreductase chain N [Acidocella aminolytica 101 = DSM 11237]SHE73377.1 NADH dehydrogenase subunit N [Acidocella aminolytica 101 = DSM 11237]